MGRKNKIKKQHSPIEENDMEETKECSTDSHNIDDSYRAISAIYNIRISLRKMCHECVLPFFEEMDLDDMIDFVTHIDPSFQINYEAP